MNINTILKVFLLVSLCSNHVLGGSVITSHETEAIHLNVTSSNVAELYDCKDLPVEVLQSISEILERHPNAEIEVFNHYKPDTTLSPLASESYWGSTRTYNGYTLKDWYIKTTDAFDMCLVLPDSSWQYAMSFSTQMIASYASNILSYLNPFLSYGVTAAQYLISNGNTYYASAGDKLNAAPQYICYEKFTYVYIDGQAYLGVNHIIQY